MTAPDPFTGQLDAPHPTAQLDAADLLDAADRALNKADIAAATELLDQVAMLAQRPVEHLRFRLGEGRLASDGGRHRFALASFEAVIAGADALGSPDAAPIATTARIELSRLAMRSGRVQLAARAASGITMTDAPLTTVVMTAAEVGSGNRAAAAGLDAATDAALAAEGSETGAIIAETAGLALVWAEHYDAADRLLARLGRLARRDGDRVALPSLLAVQSLADLRTSRYREAAAAADEAIRLAEATARPGLAVLPTAVLAVAEAIRGDAEGCRAAAQRLAEDAVRNGAGDVGADVPARAALGLLHLGLGEPDQAVAHLEPLVGRADGTPWLVMWQMDLAEAFVQVGRRDDARDLVDSFLHRPESTGHDRVQAAAARVRAMLVDDISQSELLLDQSERTCRSIGSPFGLGRTLLVRGIVRRVAGEEAASLSDLVYADTVFRSVGAEGWAAQAVNAQGSPVGETVQPGPVNPSPLTPQELQVAGLVASGRSNREVADLLFVSARTVESHLGRIYRKLGIKSRSKLIARAHEWGLDTHSW